MKIIEVSAGVVTALDGRVLVCRRRGGDHDGLWEFPGGKRETGESFAECLVRELWEELRLSVQVEGELCRMPYEDGEKRLLFSFLRAKAGETRLRLTVHRDARWVWPEELSQYRFCPADEEFLRKNPLPVD